MISNILTEIEKLIEGKIISLQKDYYDVSETCQVLGISKSTLYKLNLRKALAYYRPTGSKKIYYKRTDILNYITENRFMSKSEMEAKSQSYFENKGGLGYGR